MSTDEIKYAQEIIDAHSRRLHKLEVQSALHGIDTPPAIQIEIEDIKRKIDERQREIERIIERNRLENNLSTILEEQNVNVEQLIFNSQVVDIKMEVKETIESVLKEMLNYETKIEQEEGITVNNPSWYREMAKGFASSGAWESAARHYDKYVEYDPDNWEVHFLRAVAYANSRAGRHTDLAALRALNEAIALAPDDLDINLRARLHGYRGADFKRLNRLEEAESELLLAKKWAREQYELDDITYNLACVYAMTKNKEKMLDHLRHLVKRMPWKSVIRTKEHYFRNYWDDPDFRKLINL